VAVTALLLTFVAQAHAVGNSPIDECCDPCYCAPACCGKAFVSADLLYWRAFQGGLDNCFPLENVDYITSSGDVISKFRGEGEDPHYDWEAGFRLGVGYEFGNCWDVGVFWTHFHSNSKEREGSQHRLRWKLDFEVLDIVAGYSYDIGSCFAVRGFGGLRAARIEQKLRINSKGRADSYIANSSSYDSYSGSSSYSSFSDSYPSINSEIFMDDLSASGYSSSGLTTGSGHGKNKLMGVGPLIGIEGDWKLGCGFSLYANASFAVLYGNFRVHFNQSEKFIDGGDFCNIKRRLHACQAVVDAGLGIRWETCICENIVWFQLGLEHHRYFNQNRFGDYGDLCLDGGNFSAGFAF
jgi:hypothetical protein